MSAQSQYTELQELKSELYLLQDSLQELRDDAVADGEIDADEQAEIDELEDIIRQIQGECDELESQMAAQQEDEEGGGLSDMIGDFFGDAVDTAEDWIDTKVESAKKTLQDVGVTSDNPNESPAVVGGSIKGSVGKGGDNDPDDVRIVQCLLVKAGKKLGTSGPNGDGVDGDCGKKTKEAISSFQQAEFGWQDGLVAVGGDTWNALSEQSPKEGPAAPSLGASPQAKITFIVEHASGAAVEGAYISFHALTDGGQAPAGIASDLPASPMADLKTDAKGRAEITLHQNWTVQAAFQAEDQSYKTAPVNIYAGAGPQTVTLTVAEEGECDNGAKLVIDVVDGAGVAVSGAWVSTHPLGDVSQSLPLPDVETDKNGQAVITDVYENLTVRANYQTLDGELYTSSTEDVDVSAGGARKIQLRFSDDFDFNWEDEREREEKLKVSDEALAHIDKSSDDILAEQAAFEETGRDPTTRPGDPDDLLFPGEVSQEDLGTGEPDTADSGSNRLTQLEAYTVHVLKDPSTRIAIVAESNALSEFEKEAIIGAVQAVLEARKQKCPSTPPNDIHGASRVFEVDGNKVYCGWVLHSTKEYDGLVYYDIHGLEVARAPRDSHSLPGELLIDLVGGLAVGLARGGARSIFQRIFKGAKNIKRGRLFAKANKAGTTSLSAGEGETDKFGNVLYSTLGTTDEVALVRYHESVHSFFSPKFILFRELRADFAMFAYNRSATLRYIEEALAESYAQMMVHGIRELPTGIRFPIAEGYVTLQAVVAEGAVGTIVVGGTTYYAFHDPE